MLNQTFDVSQISPLTSAGVHQDVAVIAVEVSATTAAQASKEFQCMWEPKITKLKGGYLADAELVFWSWHADIEAHIVDHNLNNPAALQLIKDQPLEGPCHEVEYQLNLCGGGGLLIIVNSLNILVSLSRGERMKQIFLQSSIVEHKNPRSLKKPLQMSFNSLPTR